MPAAGNPRILLPSYGRNPRSPSRPAGRHLHQRVHVADMAAHVAEHQKASPVARACFFRSARSITRSGVISTNTAVPCGGNRPGTGASVKALVSTGSLGCNPQARSAQPRHSRPRPRQTEPRPHQGREFGFQRGRLGCLARRGVVAVQPPVAHHLDRGRNPRSRDRFLLGKAAGEPLAHVRSDRLRAQNAAQVIAMQPAATNRPRRVTATHDPRPRNGRR